MNNNKKVCELCRVPLQTLGFKLKTKNGVKFFCCEGCKSVYSMLHRDSIPPKSG